MENNGYPRDFRVRREARALRNAGYDVTVVAPREAPQPYTDRIDGVDVYRFPAPRGGSGIWSYAFEFAYATLAILLLTAWIWLRRGIDVIHVANPPDTLFIIGAVCKLFGIRFVFDQHDLGPETYLSRFGRTREDVVHRVLRLLEHWSYATADVVLVTNQSYRHLAVTRGQKRADRVFVVRNAPPLSYQPVAPDPHLVQRATYLIGYVGTIGPQDGVDYWLRAVHQLVFRFGRRDFLAVLIGDGDARPAAQALASHLGIDDHVWFTGRLSETDARTHLSAVHVCVQPDPLSPLNDKSSMAKLMDYMALGKPTVAFDLLETRYSAQHAAVYVEPNDEVAFAEQVLRLLDDPIERKRRGEVGRRRFSESLAWEYSERELLRAYREGLRLP